MSWELSSRCRLCGPRPWPTTGPTSRIWARKTGGFGRRSVFADRGDGLRGPDRSRRLEPEPRTSVSWSNSAPNSRLGPPTSILEPPLRDPASADRLVGRPCGFLWPAWPDLGPGSARLRAQLLEGRLPKLMAVSTSQGVPLELIVNGQTFLAQAGATLLAGRVLRLVSSGQR